MALLAGLACVGGITGVALRTRTTRPDDEFNPLIIHGGPATPSLSLIHLAESKLLSPIVENIRFQMFRGIDEVRAGLVGNGWPISMVPSQLAANLFNRKMPIYYMSVLTWGLMYFISRAQRITNIEQFAGSRVALPSKNDLFDQMFNYWLNKAGFHKDRDIKITYMSSPVEAAQWLHAGQVDHALLPEPQCSAAIMQSNEVPLYRSLPFGALRQFVDGDHRIPMAGIMIHQHVLDRRPEIVSKLRQALHQSVRWARNNPLAAAQASVPYFSIPAPIIAAAVEHSNLVADDATLYQSELHDYFEMICEFNSDMIGGKAPDIGFYI
ncbi:MAG: ABC transporter substrate-binding protein [Burkholderiales bacterium]|jgi:NitT/TauT family transport system substrate-binding protein|nr:ABC transporter substrate-binding protein [Burkholderiales bacterium]